MQVKKLVKKIINWIVFLVSLVFLVVMFSNEIKNFGIEQVFTTNGLELVIIIITFFGTLMQNSKLYIPIFNNIILSQKLYTYYMSILLEEKDDQKSIDNYMTVIENKIVDKKNIKCIEPIYNRIASVKKHYRNIKSNINISRDVEQSEVLIKFDGAVRYKDLKKIINLIKDLFLDGKLPNGENIVKLEMKIDLELSEINFKTLFQLDTSNCNLQATIDLDESTSFKITNDNIIIESLTKSGFFKGYDQMNKLLVKYVLGG